MKIAVPNFIIWLLGFYAIFHVYLNILGELTRFADRQFYRDWWNSTTLGYFWRYALSPWTGPDPYGSVSISLDKHPLHTSGGCVADFTPSAHGSALPYIHPCP